LCTCVKPWKVLDLIVDLIVFRENRARSANAGRVVAHGLVRFYHVII
jgi:hypothetical protein